MNALYLLGLPLATTGLSLVLGRQALLQRVLALVSLLGAGFLLFSAYESSFSGLAVQIPWVKAFGIYLALDINALNFWFLVLTSLVVFMALLYHTTLEKEEIRTDVLALIHLLQFFLYGVFLAQDLLLFYFCFEATILPIYFISSRYGTAAAERATLKFFLYTLAGSLAMLLGILYVYIAGGSQDFLFSSLAALSLPGSVQGWLFLAFFLAFAIKMPLFPFHSWQADVYSESPVESTMLMSGILLKMGIYGMMVLVVPMFPLGVKEYGPLFISLAAFGVVFGALIAMVQFDIRRVLAYSSLSHVGLMGAGILAYSEVAMEGVVLQMFAHGVNITGLFFVSEIIRRHTGTRDLDQMGGLTKKSMPLTILFFVLLLGSIAVPLTNGFPGEFKLLMGLVDYNVWLGLVCGLTVIFSSVYMLTLFQKAMLGKVPDPAESPLSGLGLSRILGLGFLVALVLGLGLFPQVISALSDSAVRTLLSAY